MPKPMRSTVILVLLTAVFTAMPLTGQDVKTTVSPGQDFTKFRKYGWRENLVAPKSLPNEREAADKTIKAILNRELSKKGYTEDPQAPDFLIEVRAGTIPGEIVTSARDDVRVPDQVTVYNSQFPAGPGVDMWMSVTAGARIIVTDSTSNATAWEALVTKKYKNPDKYKHPDRLEKEMDSFFTKGIKPFPSKK